jgi:hypothetical protein
MSFRNLPLSLAFLTGCAGSLSDIADNLKDSNRTGTAGDEDGDAYTESEGDCDEGNSEVNPGATEVCDGIDNDCDGDVDEDVMTSWYLDADEDGFGDGTASQDACEAPGGYVSTGSDCDDTSASAYPGANEICDGLDNDCDGTIDNGVTQTWYPDADADGYGDGGSPEEACEQESGMVANGDDCDDGNARSYPGNTEVCDEIDNDCNGSVDEGVTTTYYADLDGDGYGDADLTAEECALPTGYSSNADDCDDGNDTINPAATEMCDGVDNNCDGATDDDTAADVSTWYADGDADGYGDAASPDVACYEPTGYVSDSTDCDDTRALTNPGASEYCNLIDDDCDGTVDEDDAVDASTWYIDVDKDGQGSSAFTEVSCAQPTGYVSNADDCNDGSADAYLGATEYCDGIDNDCDGVTDEDDAVDASTWYADADGDNYGNPAASDVECDQPSGYVSDSSDCDDTDDGVYPGAPEYCDGEDDDCDGTIDEDDALDSSTWYADSDGDGYGDSATTDEACTQPSGYVSNDDDCDDSRALTNPAATEYCNTYDDDCDGLTDEDDAVDASVWYADADGDGFGNAAKIDIACEQPSGYLSDSSDCDDSTAAAYPGADEVCDGIDNDCDGDIDEDGGVDDGETYYADADGDGTGDPDSTVVACAAPSGYVDNYYDCNDGDAGEPTVADAVNGTASGSGTWADPYDTLQAAIDGAYECVLALAGTYQEAIELGSSDVDIWGVEGSDYTTIDGNTSTCGSSDPTACASAVTIATGTGAAPTLHGFTITGGSGTMSSSTTSTTCADSSASHAGRNTCSVTTYEYCGGGVYIDGDDPYLYDIVIEDNSLPPFEQAKMSSFTQYWLYSYGGGVCAKDTNAVFEGVDVWSNYADQGGGIYVTDGGNFSFSQGYVSENEATDGAGFGLDGAGITVENAIIHCNDADTDGGGVYSESSGSSEFTNVVFYKNTCSTSGSARGSEVYAGSSTSITLLNTIAQSASSAYSLYGVGVGTTSYSDVYNSSGSEYGGTFSAAASDISTDPAFTSVKCDGNPKNDDFSLKSTSSAINAGDSSSAYNDSDGSRNDMGAYGGPEGGW